MRPSHTMIATNSSFASTVCAFYKNVQTNRCDVVETIMIPAWKGNTTNEAFTRHYCKKQQFRLDSLHTFIKPCKPSRRNAHFHGDTALEGGPVRVRVATAIVV